MVSLCILLLVYGFYLRCLAFGLGVWLILGFVFVCECCDYGLFDLGFNYWGVVVCMLRWKLWFVFGGVGFGIVICFLLWFGVR